MGLRLCPARITSAVSLIFALSMKPTPKEIVEEEKSIRQNVVIGKVLRIGILLWEIICW